MTSKKKLIYTVLVALIGVSTTVVSHTHLDTNDSHEAEHNCVHCQSNLSEQITNHTPSVLLSPSTHYQPTINTLACNYQPKLKDTKSSRAPPTA